MIKKETDLRKKNNKLSTSYSKSMTNIGEKPISIIELIRSVNTKTYGTGKISTHLTKNSLSISTLPGSYFELNKSCGDTNTSLESKNLCRTSSLPAEIFDSFSFISPINKGKLEEYSFSKTIGKGPYSTVRAAVHIPSNAAVAIKTYRKFKFLDSKIKKCVFREIHILENLTHPNIINFIDKIQTPNDLHIVLDYFKGKTLLRYIEDKPSKKLTEFEAKYIFRQIVDAIAHCHDHNVSHRDIKLENILVNDNHQVKVVDFGFSTCLPRGKKTKVFCGTPCYFAPEIVKRQEFEGPPADIWALGVLLAYLLTGKYPFRGASNNELYSKILTGKYIIPKSLSKPSQNLILKMLKRVPGERISACSLLNENWLNSGSFINY